MNNLLKRTITGAVFALIMLGTPFLGKTAFILLFFIISVLSLHEFYHILQKGGKTPQLLSGLLIGICIFCIPAFYLLGIIEVKFLWITAALIFIPFFVELWRKKPLPVENVALTITGIVYTVVPSVFVAAFSTFFTTNSGWIYLYIGFLLLIWANDVFAYLVGSAIGRHKLFERISPSKTIEGTLGGVVFTVLAAWLLHYTPAPLLAWQWMLMAAIICITAIPGDLIESLFKRSLGIKDSGNLLPGHGGLLDRFDAMFLAAPFVFVYLMILLN